MVDFKVEKILKGILDLISSPSPSVKIQIMSGKVCLRCRVKTFLGDVNKLFDIDTFYGKGKVENILKGRLDSIPLP